MGWNVNTLPSGLQQDLNGFDINNPSSWGTSSYHDPSTGSTWYLFPHSNDQYFNPETGKYGLPPTLAANAQNKLQGAANTPSLTQQIMPIVGGAVGTGGGILAAHEAAGLFSGGAKAGGTAGTTGATAVTPAATGGAAASTGASAAGSSGGILGSGASSGAVPVGTAANGGTLMSEGSIAGASAGDAGAAGSGATAAGSSGGILDSLSEAPATGSIGQIAGAAGALYGGYNTINDWQHGGSGRTGLTEAGAGVGEMAGGPIGAGIGAIYGNIMGYGLQGNGILNHLALLGTNPLLEVGRDLGFNVIHETTRQNAEKHTSQLLDQAKNDPTYQNYVSAMRQQFSAPPPDPSHTFGKYATWDEAKTAGLDASTLTGVYGNLNTFGPEWAHLSQQQRLNVTQAMINNGLYDSKKGEVIITDPDKAMSIYDDMKANGFSLPQPKAGPTAGNPSPVSPSPQNPNIQNQGGSVVPKPDEFGFRGLL